jgi:putative transposase
VTDLTYVPTRSGMAYVCLIVDAFSRKIVGWRAVSNMKTEMVLEAFEIARASRGGTASSVWSHIRMPGRKGNSPRCGSPSGWRRSAPARRSGRSRTPMTTPWPTTNGLYKTECV